VKKVVFYLIVSSTFLITHLAVKGQSNSAKYLVDSSEDAHCELNNRFIDSLVIEAKKGDERIFIISRLNTKEKFGWNRARLSRAYSILTEVKNIKSEQIVIAIGDRTSERKGRIEFYLGSQLFLVSLAENGKQICFLCCN
jgi:hypothetical protein